MRYFHILQRLFTVQLKASNVLLQQIQENDRERYFQIQEKQRTTEWEQLWAKAPLMAYYPHSCCPQCRASRLVLQGFSSDERSGEGYGGSA